MKAKTKRLTSKIALAVAIVLLVIWSVMGAGASLAWFQDETPPVKNVFNFGVFDLEVYYKNDTMSDFALLDNAVAVFNDEALYEPGYTQVVHMKVKNKSSIDINYKVSIEQRRAVVGYTEAGEEIYLPDYLKYGVMFADSEIELTRALAQQNAPRDMAELALGEYSQWDGVTLAPEQERYLALVIYMPTEIGNRANYRGDEIPTVELGLTIDAQQTDAPQL